ncbi:MAG: rRNA (guanine966-N2)-methyltransferase [Actinomycetota bacterium]
MRPTTDRVREAVGNRLMSQGVLRDARVLDLFAGTGAYGIEALSRGAAHATFVENAPAALAALQANIEALGMSAETTIVRGDAVSYATSARSADAFDVAFVDPPYSWDGWESLLDGLHADIAVCEARHPVAVPGGWELVRSDRYGTTVITLLSAARVNEGSP